MVHFLNNIIMQNFAESKLVCFCVACVYLHVMKRYMDNMGYNNCEFLCNIL